MKAIAFVADMGSLSTNSRQPSFRLKVKDEVDKEANWAFVEMQEKEVRVVIEPLEGASDELKLSGHSDLKSPSQRLRGSLFALWKESKSEDDFEHFYTTQMNRYIDHVQTKIDQAKGII